MCREHLLFPLNDVCPTEVNSVTRRSSGSNGFALIGAHSPTRVLLSVLLCNSWLAQSNICFVPVEGGVTSWLKLVQICTSDLVMQCFYFRISELCVKKLFQMSILMENFGPHGRFHNILLGRISWRISILATPFPCSETW